MKYSRPLKKLASCSVLTALAAGASIAHAHTTIQNTLTTSSSTYSNLVIGHGCTDAQGKKWPVVAQSVVFPTVNPHFFRSTDLVNEATDITLGDNFGTPAKAAVPESGTPGTPGYKAAQPAKDAVDTTTLANIFQLIQNKDIFKFQREKTDAQGNVIGFEGWGGRLDPTLYGLVPFRATNVVFKPESCINNLIVKVAVADICRMPFPPKDGTANLWMPNTTTKFAVALDGTSTQKFAGSPATFTFPRPASVPLDANTCGAGFDLLVYPSDEDVDANLPMQKRWGR